MKKEQLKADLSLLKKYVEEIEVGLDKAYDIRDSFLNEKGKEFITKHNQFLIELSKVTGLCVGISQEAGLITSDLQTIAKYSKPSSEDSEDEPLNILNNFLKNNKNTGEN